MQPDDRADNTTPPLSQASQGLDDLTTVAPSSDTERPAGTSESLEHAHFTADNAPTLGAKDGIHRQRYTRDENGNLIAVASFGLRGEPALTSNEGIHRWTARHDEHNRRIEITCFGTDGKPINNKLGYQRRTWAYDRDGKATVRDFDAAGKLLPPR